MQSGVTWWSEQFWIQMTTTSMGVLASVGLAVGLYFLKRWHDRKDEAARREHQKQERLTSELLELLREHRDLPLTNVERVHPRSIGVLTTMFGARIYDYEVQLTDPYLKSFCRICRKCLIGDFDSDPNSVELVERYARFTTTTTFSLAEYLAEGKAIDLDRIESLAKPAVDEGDQAQIVSSDDAT